MKSSNNIILNIIEKIDTEKYLYIIMDLCLTNINEYFYTRGKSFEFEEIKEIIFQMGKILQLLNENNITHKIFELSNFLISFDTINKITIKLSEISLKQWNNENLKIKDFITPPEIIKNKKKFYNSDIWTLGTIFYYILFGEYPYKEKNEKKFFEEIKKNELKKTNCDEINDLIEKMLCFDINKRISWNDFFNHSFFQNNLNKKIETIVNSNKIIKEEKNILPNEIHLSEIIEVKTDDQISLGINIGASKTLYSLFLKENNDKYITKVLLMNNSSRIIPSIICYTKDHRLIGDNSTSSLKQHLSTSYNNLSRIIGYNEDIKIYEKEILFGFDGISNLNKEKSYYHNSTEKKKIKSEVIISDFLGLLKKYYIKTEKYYYTSTYISVPDFFSSYQKEELRLICKSLYLMDVNIFNESSAITMYYGYTKYRDNFVIGKNKVDTTITKNVLFIDIGHSKSSFILSTFHYSKFKINYVLTLPFIGGRNFDELIINYCIEYFKKKKNFNDLEVTSKMKYRLLESVRKARIQLTVNTEASILVDVFYNEEDLELVLEKVKFEELINDCVKEIDNTLKEVINYAKKNNIIIDCVEIAGELMRTPILQKIIENKGLKICKSLLIDECTSVGSAILGNYKLGKLPIANFKKFYHYNYYSIDYEIIQNDQVQEKNNLLNIGTVQDTEVKIKIKKDYIIQDKPIYIKIFYNDEDNNNVKLTTNNLILIEYEIDLFKMLNGNKIEDDIFFKMEIDSCQKLLNEEIIFNDQKFKNNINIIKGGIYKTYGKENQFKKQIMKSYSSHKLFDSNYHLIVEKKNQMSKSLYSLKSIVEKNPELKEDLNKIQVLDKKIHNLKAPYDTNSLEQIQKEIENLENYINNKLKDL